MNSSGQCFGAGVSCVFLDNCFHVSITSLKFFGFFMSTSSSLRHLICTNTLRIKGAHGDEG